MVGFWFWDQYYLIHLRIRRCIIRNKNSYFETNFLPTPSQTTTNSAFILHNLMTQSNKVFQY